VQLIVGWPHERVKGVEQGPLLRGGATVDDSVSKCGGKRNVGRVKVLQGEGEGVVDCQQVVEGSEDNGWRHLRGLAGVHGGPQRFKFTKGVAAG